MCPIKMTFGLFQAINKSKKAKEVEILLQENETLQLKLYSQEDDFRLQNETLMQELSQVWNEPGHEKTCLYVICEQQRQISLRIRAVWSAPLLFAPWIV